LLIHIPKYQKEEFLMKKPIALFALLLIIPAMLLVAGGAQEAGDDQLQVGYTVQSMENDYFVSVVEGMEARAEELGVRLIVADAAADADRHINHINNFIAQGVDAIIISPVDQVAPEGAVAEAVASGIPVVALNQNVAGSSAGLLMEEYQYGFRGGQMAGEWLNEKEADGSIVDILNADGAIEVGIVRYDTISSLIDRGDGLKDGITQTYTGGRTVNFVFEQDGADSAAGNRIAETALTAYPSISIFACINDSSALGVFEAASAYGKDASNFAVTGLDGLPQALRYISEDTMFIGTVDSLPVQLGADGLDLALRVAEEGSVSEPMIATMKMVTQANIDEYADVIR
jgi:ABC-type sugar transport system substrate-binding protein